MKLDNKNKINGKNITEFIMLKKWILLIKLNYKKKWMDFIQLLWKI